MYLYSVFQHSVLTYSFQTFYLKHPLSSLHLLPQRIEEKLNFSKQICTFIRKENVNSSVIESRWSAEAPLAATPASWFWGLILYWT